MKDDRSAKRVALVANTSHYIGPALALELARRGHDLVIGDPRDGLVEELEALGCAVEVVTGVADLAEEGAGERLARAGLERFGRLDAAAAFSGAIVVGRFLESRLEEVRTLERGCFEAPYLFLRAVLPPMVEAGNGQVLILTSSSGQRTTPGAPIYSAMRAGATHLVRNVARELAKTGVQVNGLGTNFMDFPAFLEASNATDPEGRARVEARVPMRRLGTLEECAALCCAYLDGTCGFVTGQFVSHDGGWS